jgi:hypothetical protein
MAKFVLTNKKLFCHIIKITKEKAVNSLFSIHCASFAIIAVNSRLVNPKKAS